MRSFFKTGLLSLLLALFITYPQKDLQGQIKVQNYKVDSIFYDLPESGVSLELYPFEGDSIQWRFEYNGEVESFLFDIKTRTVITPFVRLNEIGDTIAIVETKPGNDYRFKYLNRVGLIQGVPHGDYVVYNHEGQLKVQSHIVDGMESGEYRSFHDNGKMAKHGYMNADKKDSFWREWNEEGTLVSEQLITQERPFSGGTFVRVNVIKETTWYSDGQIRSFLDRTGPKIIRKKWNEKGLLIEAYYQDSFAMSIDHKGEKVVNDFDPKKKLWRETKFRKDGSLKSVEYLDGFSGPSLGKVYKYDENGKLIGTDKPEPVMDMVQQYQAERTTAPGVYKSSIDGGKFGLNKGDLDKRLFDTRLSYYVEKRISKNLDKKIKKKQRGTYKVIVEEVGEKNVNVIWSADNGADLNDPLFERLTEIIKGISFMSEFGVNYTFNYGLRHVWSFDLVLE